ncbi:M48 family metalloprotease [Thalassospira sp.]|uniref:M48 family metalloprotease n=1 Tax=Thalassospira sp. TaxID=1912094 RepID=UPI003AA84B52
MKFLKWSLPAAMLMLAGCVTNQTGVPIPFLSPIPDDAKYIETVKLPTTTLEKAEGLKKARTKVLTSSVGLADFPQLQSYAQSVLDRIIATAPAGAPDAKVYLLANVGPGAMAVPEGAIYIHFSAFQYLQSEDQLAFLLGHEYSHVALQHSPENLLRSLRPYLVTAMDFAVSRASSDSKLRKSLQLYGSDILSRDVLLPVWDRSAEKEADFLGLDLMTKAGYNPSESLRFLAIVGKYDDSFERLHLATRNQLEKQLDAQLATTTDSPLWNRFTSEFRDAIGTIQEQISSRHEDAKDRMVALVGYMKREYAMERRRPINNAIYVKTVDQNADVLDHYLDAHKVIAALQEAEFEPGQKINIGKLEGLARRAVSGKTSDHAYTRYAFSKLRTYQGKYSLALKNIDLIAGQDGDDVLPFQISLERAELQQSTGNSKLAIKQMEVAAAHYDWPVEAYHFLIPMLAGQGDKGRVNELKIGCVARYPQQRELCATPQ